MTETVGDYWFHTAALGLEWKGMVILTADLFNLFDDRSTTDIDVYLPEFNHLAGYRSGIHSDMNGNRAPGRNDGVCPLARQLSWSCPAGFADTPAVRGGGRQLSSLRFIDWIMALPDDLEKAYHRELTKYEEEVKMPYVTTAERIGIEKGKIEIARNLLQLGVLTEDQIAQATELSIEEVRQLRNETSRSSD